jgi:hypothetical protein
MAALLCQTAYRKTEPACNHYCFCFNKTQSSDFPLSSWENTTAHIAITLIKPFAGTQTSCEDEDTQLLHTVSDRFFSCRISLAQSQRLFDARTPEILYTGYMDYIRPKHCADAY